MPYEPFGALDVVGQRAVGCQKTPLKAGTSREDCKMRELTPETITDDPTAILKEKAAPAPAAS